MTNALDFELRDPGSYKNFIQQESVTGNVNYFDQSQHHIINIIPTMMAI